MLYTNKFDHAPSALQHLNDTYAAEGLSKQALRTNLADVKHLWADVTNSSRLRAQIFDRLPRFKPCINDIPEYNSMGHDDTEDFLSKAQIEAIAACQDNISTMFCGSGDARHILSTLVTVGRTFEMGADKRIKKLHFTLVDVKPAALAKFIIILDMLIRYSVMKIMKTPGHQDALVVVAYLYTCQIIPPFVLQKLYDHLDRLIELLDGGQDIAQHEVMPFIYIPPDIQRAVLNVFKQWRHPISSHYAVACARPTIWENVKMKRSHTAAAFGPERSVSKKDRKDFNSWGYVFADMNFFKRREPELATLYEACHSNASHKQEQLEEYLNAN